MSSGTLSRRPANHSYSADAAKLDNNLDALLEDLQTSVTPSRSTMNSRNEYTTESISRKSPLRSVSPLRSMSPSNAVTTTVEKYVTTGPAGSASGIPGLEMLDAELQDVQPGQTKTVAYKQVSYHYDKSQEGKDLEPWSKTETIKSTKSSADDSCILDGILERTYDESRSVKNVRDSPDFAKSSSSKSSANKEIIYKADVTTKTIPVQPTTIETRSSTRDHKIIKETSYRTSPSPITSRKNLQTMRNEKREEISNVEYIPPSVPANLAPGPNTKVTTTVKTYTYELPGAPETYVNSSSSMKNVDKSIQYSTYSLPRTTTTTTTEKKSFVDEQSRGVREYTTIVPTTVHREDKKVIMEEHRAYRPITPPPTQSTMESKVIRKEQYMHSNGGYVPPTRSVDHVDHSTSLNRSEKTYYYEKEPVVIPVNETTRTTVKQYEEHYSNRPPKPVYPTTETTSIQNKSLYKYSESSTPKTFPTSVRPSSPQQKPPKRLEDLMASFSDTEEVVVEVDRVDKPSRTVKEHTIKKEVEFTSKSPQQIKTKNITGPPVYYPPGSAEFTRKEESYGAMSRSGGGWAKERAAWEYGSSSKSTQKEKQKKAVVPVCLPLCCALPCVIM